MIINSKIYNIPNQSSAIVLNDKIVLVIISSTLTTTEDELLKKILNAAGLAPDQFKHIIQDKETLALKNFTNTNKRLKIISFDISPKSLGMQVDVQKYQEFRLHNLDIVYVNDLATIGQEVNLKKYIWGILKSWFIEK